MIDKPLDQIGWADIERLVESSTSEGRRLEYKRDLPAGRDADIREFLSDLTSFANTDGGDLIIGIRDEDGVAGEIIGVGGPIDAAVLRLDNIARDGIDPRLSGLLIHPIPHGDRAVLVLRVPASFAAPHRVTYKGSSRFLARNSRGKFEMDTHDLRHAFAASEDAPRQLRDLHHRTVRAASGENMPAALVEGPSLLVTVAPLSILRDRVDLPVTRENALLPPKLLGGLQILLGFEGVVVLAGFNPSGFAGSFSINHRTGYMSAGWFIGRILDDVGIVWPNYVTRDLLGFVQTAVTRLSGHGLTGPWVVMATITGIKDFRLILAEHHWSDAAWQDAAYLGELTFETLTPNTLQPFIDGVARLFGMVTLAAPAR